MKEQFQNVQLVCKLKYVAVFNSYICTMVGFNVIRVYRASQPFWLETPLAHTKYLVTPHPMILYIQTFTQLTCDYGGCAIEGTNFHWNASFQWLFGQIN